jgi:hypothetical protein
MREPYLSRRPDSAEGQVRGRNTSLVASIQTKPISGSMTRVPWRCLDNVRARTQARAVGTMGLDAGEASLT